MKLGRFDVTKAVRAQGDMNSLHDLTGMISKSPSIPTLMSDLLGGSIESEFLSTNTFEHDSTERFIADIKDKSFSERGEAFDQRGETKTHLFKVPSFGIQTHVKPSDALRRRVEGTKDEMETIDRLVAKDIADIQKSWALFEERQIVSTITTGGLYVPNGSVQSYDFYQEYTGTAASSRPTVDFNFADDTAYPREVGEEARNFIADNLLDGQTIDGFICLCGKEFFKQRISHPKEEQAMVQRAGILGQDPLIDRLDNFTNGAMYRKYRGADDILYVEYTAKVGGLPLIADDEGYIMPLNAGSVFTRAYAPAETMQYANTTAQSQYAWRFDDEFSGTKLYWESNQGLYLTNPNTIVKATMTVAP